MIKDKYDGLINQQKKEIELKHDEKDKLQIQINDLKHQLQLNLTQQQRCGNEKDVQIK